MDAQANATLLRPQRLRLFRRSPSPRPAEATPQPGPSSVARSLFSALNEDEDEFPTPRVLPKSIAPPNIDPTPRSFPASISVTPVPTETPALRLRALLARESRSPASSTPVLPPAPPSDLDSLSQSVHLGSSTSSVTRGSLKDLFSRALRDPGDTPEKGRPRRNSFDGSSMEITPVVDRNRGQRKHARRSLSDEEAENPKSNRRSRSPFRFSTAVTFDNLRSRLMSSQSQLLEQNLQEALYDQPSLASTSTSNSQHHLQSSTSTPQLHQARATPSVTAITPHPSFQITSQLISQSNLLEQDSEMQRAMGEALNSESEASASTPDVVQSTQIPSGSHPPTPPHGRRSSSIRRASYGFDSSTTHFSAGENADKMRRSQEGDCNHLHEREWNRPRLPSGPTTPEVHRRHSQDFHRRLSQEIRLHPHAQSHSHESVISQSSPAGPGHRRSERRGSIASLRSFDDDRSSRPSSIGSQADYRDRISELEQERKHEREREWNKRHPPSRPSSSLSNSSSHSFSRSHPPRSPSAIPYLTPTHASLQRKSSRTSLRSDSPSSLASSRESLKEREEEETKEVVYERERNWNSPRPHWSTSKSPTVSQLNVRNKDTITLRATTSLTRLRDSNGHEDTSHISTKLQSASPKADISFATLPASLHESGNHLDFDADPGPPQTSLSDNSSPSKTPGAASRFGWNFVRSPLPPLEFDDPVNHRKSTSSPTPGAGPSSKTPETMPTGHIPVRSRMKSFSSVGHATSDMSFTHVVGDEVSGSHGREEAPVTRTPWSPEDVVLASDEEPISDLPPQSTTPKSNPPDFIPEEFETDAETEVLSSPSPQGSPQSAKSASVPSEGWPRTTNHSQPPDISQEEPPISATPPGTPPSAGAGSQLPTSERSPSFALVTPPRQKSFGSSVLDFKTPSPPHDLPDLPGPPTSSDDDAFEDTSMKDVNFTLTKTPKPPGAWAATPLPLKVGHRSSSPALPFPLESTPPASTSTPLPRINTYAHTRVEPVPNNPGDLITPMGALPRAKSHPLRTPAPPGAWWATPGQSTVGNGTVQSQYGSLGRRKGQLKVRFDVAESETSATEGHPNSPLSAIRLINHELPLPKLATAGVFDDMKAVVNEELRSSSHRPTTPERPATPISRENGTSPRSLRKSPAVRLVDAYGRERVDEERNTTSPVAQANGHADAEQKVTTSPPTPRHSLVRVVDAMGRKVDDNVEIPDALEVGANKSFETDVSVVSDDSPVGHAEALVRIRMTLKGLAESLSDADRSEDLELNSSHVEQLEEVSQAARLARNQLAHNLHLETAKEQDLKHKNKFSVWTRGLPPAPTKPWNTAIIYCGVVIQLLLVLAMWRYAHTEAHRLFYTTYYDPLYPEFTPIEVSSYVSGALPTSRSWTLFDSYETIRREGLSSIRKEMLRAVRHVGDHAWERWGEHAQFEKPT